MFPSETPNTPKACTMNMIFSNRWRWLKMTSLILILFLLCWRSFIVNSQRTAAYFSAIQDGRALTLTHFEITRVTSEDMTIQIPDGRFPLVVSPPPADAEVGDIVNLKVVKRDGVLQVTACETRKWRDLKIWISIPVILAVAWLFGRRYRFAGKQGSFLPQQRGEHA